MIVALEGPLSVGRRPERDVALTWDGEVSRLHAQLEPVGPDWTVADDGLSRNGTYVNGQRISGRKRLKDGDRIAVGETPITFRAPRDATDSTAAIKLSGPVALSEGRRKVPIALWRPLKDSAYAAPATNRDIAAEVHLSVDAVKAHLRVSFERFGPRHAAAEPEALGARGDRPAERRRQAAPVLSRAETSTHLLPRDASRSVQKRPMLPVIWVTGRGF